MNNLSINDRQVGDVTILDIDGNLRLGEGTAVLHKAIRRMLEAGQNQILLNLAHVTYIDSSGLGELVAAHVALSKSGGRIKLLHLTRRVNELMTITKLLTVFEVYENESTALDSFKTLAVDLEEHAPVLAQGGAR
ncbi:MAG TPA: STAS domain-containing protein [Pyrinomonadaceae bacterium]|jgi:anti-sigma B factor antagonist